MKSEEEKPIGRGKKWDSGVDEDWKLEWAKPASVEKEDRFGAQKVRVMERWNWQETGEMEFQ